VAFQGYGLGFASGSANVSGITATGVLSEPFELAGASTSVGVAFSGTALAAGAYTLNLTSATLGAGAITPVTVTQTAAQGQSFAGVSTAFSFTMPAADVNDLVVTLSFAPAALITSAGSADFTVGSPGSFTVTTANGANSVSQSGALPSGVTFTDHGNGTATLAGTPAPGTVNSYTITLGASNGTPPDAAQTFTLNVIKGASPMTLSASPNPARPGQPITLIATVQGDPPSGKVTFLDGGTPLGTAELQQNGAASSVASLTVPSLAQGDHILSASYEGDDNNAPSQTQQTVNLQVQAQVLATIASVPTLHPLVLAMLALALAAVAAWRRHRPRPTALPATG
jgi:hypothetical protein